MVYPLSVRLVLATKWARSPASPLWLGHLPCDFFATDNILGSRKSLGGWSKSQSLWILKYPFPSSISVTLR